MSMIFFKIGSTDLTEYADIQNYDINKVNVYQDWSDGNWVNHREIIRTRIAGKLQLGFKKTSDWNAFLALLQAQRDAEGFFPVTAYVNNTGTTDTIEAFLDLSGSGKWDILNSRFWRVITITVSER